MPALPELSQSLSTGLQGEGNTELFTVGTGSCWGSWPLLSADGHWGQVSFGLPPLLKPTLHIHTKSLDVWLGSCDSDGRNCVLKLLINKNPDKLKVLSSS